MKVLLQTNEYPIIASPQLAKKLGMPAATFLQKLYFLLNDTRKFKNKKNLTQHSNRKWWFHTFEEWQSTLGLFSVSSIKRAVSKLKELGLIEINKLDPNKSMRVNYYTINYKKLKALFGISTGATKPQPPTKSEPEKVIGTEVPVHAEATAEDLATIPRDNRSIYRQLRQYKLDIAHDDPRLFHWEKISRTVITYAASASNRLNLNKWQWHTPEQILPQELLRT